MTTTGHPQEYIHYGSIVDAVIEILGGAPEIQSFSPARISRNLVGYSRDLRWIVVNRQGGSWAWPQAAHPRIDIECYAPVGGDAEDMIETCLSVMFREQFNYTGHGVRLIAVRVETSPFESTDPLDETSRYITAIRVTVRPFP